MYSRKINKRLLEAFIKAGAFDLIAPDRATTMANLNRALQHAEQAIRDQAIGQHNLFGGTHTQENIINYIYCA